MVIFAALHMGWLKFLAVFLKERNDDRQNKLKKIQTLLTNITL